MIRIVAASLIAAAVATPVLAQDVPVARVAYADLDLATPAGQKTFAGRVDGAVAKVCPEPGTTDMDTMLAWEHCRTVAKMSARTQMLAAIDRAVRLAAKPATTQVASR